MGGHLWAGCWTLPPPESQTDQSVTVVGFCSAFPSQGQQRLGGQWTGTLSDPQKVSTFRSSSELFNVEVKGRVFLNSYFREGGDEPKVQIPFKVKPGQIPRQLVIERRRREYFNLDIEQLLSEKGIDCAHLMPTRVTPTSLLLPLEVFDNDEFDCRTPQGWLSLGTSDHRPIPAKALLPSDHPPFLGNPPSLSWQWVGVLDFSLDKHHFLVQKVLHRHRTGTQDDGQPVNQHQEDSGAVGGSQHWVPRVRLCFSGEDPRTFVKRIQFALTSRKHTEALLRAQATPLCPGALPMDSDSLQRIRGRVLSTPGLRGQRLTRRLGELEEELRLDYDHTMKHITSYKLPENQFNDSLYFPLEEPPLTPQKGRVPVPPFDYEERRCALMKNFLFVSPEVMKMMMEVSGQCRKLTDMKLFTISSTKPQRLDVFEGTHTLALTQMNLFLRDGWLVTLSKCIRSNLLSVESFGVNQSCWTLYRMSKMSRLMTRLRLLLQDSLRSLVLDSLRGVAQSLIDACNSLRSCPKQLLHSPYRTKRNPVFMVDLVLDQSGVGFSPPLERVQLLIIDLFDRGVLATHNIPQLETLVMSQLFSSGDAKLESVNVWEPEVEELKEEVLQALNASLTAVQAYADHYSQHLDLQHLDIETLIQSIEPELTSQRVKKEVELHLEEAERLDRSLPSSVPIGPFCVRVEAVRQSLTKKRKAIANALLACYTKQLRNKLDEVCEEYNTMSRKLHEKSDSVEELFNHRGWITTVPERITNLKEVFVSIMADYQLCDTFFFSLTNDDVSKQWTVIGWPQRILAQMEKVTNQHVEDEERFHRIQSADQTSLEENLESLQAVIAGFANQSDIGHAHELAKEARRVMKQLKECQAAVDTITSRQRLLSQPHTDLINDFQPFYDLWTTASDWLRWQQSFLHDPLTSVDPAHFERTLTHCHHTMLRCLDQFKDSPDVQVVAAEVRKQLEELLPHVPLVQALRTPGFRNPHWDMLSERLHIKVKAKATLTLTHCLTLGLPTHLAHITQLAQIAEQEFTIQQELEEMEEAWSEVVLTLLPNEETGGFLLQETQEASLLLDRHMVIMDTISSSPFSTTFDRQIQTWNRNLKMTQAVLEEWAVCQRSWLRLQPMFSSDLINQQRPEETTRFRRLDQKWRTVMTTAFNNPKVSDLCASGDLLVKLKACHILCQQVEKGLNNQLDNSDHLDTSDPVTTKSIKC